MRETVDPVDDADERRIRDYLSGDAATFREVEGWILTVLRACYPVLLGESDDLCQAVHQKLVGNLQEGRFHRRSAFRTYVQSVAHYTSIDRLRRKFRDVPLDPEFAESRASGSNPYHALEEKERTRLFHRVLQLSSETCRALWRMIFLDRLSYEEIGGRLGIPPGTVKSRMWHCRRKAVLLLRRLGWN